MRKVYLTASEVPRECFGRIPDASYGGIMPFTLERANEYRLPFGLKFVVARYEPVQGPIPSCCYD